MKKFFFVAAMLIAGAMISCQKADEISSEQGQAAATRAFADTPKVTMYVEVNDTNPLNAGDYQLSDGRPLAGIVELFASNIHKETVNGVVRPTLYLNDKLTNVLENGGAAKYVKGLQDKGIKVLLTVLGDWQGIGVANMNATQTTQFAEILAYVVEKYGLDGIGFDDEYSDYPWIGGVNNTSYSEIITKLHALMPADKLITVFYWGNTNRINSAAWACVDYAYPGNFSAYTYQSNPSPLTKAQWSPMALNLGNTYDDSDLEQIYNNSARVASEGYGAIMTFNIRRSSDVDPLPVFEMIAAGAYEDEVTCANGNRPQDWTFVPSGYTITVDDAQ